VKFKELNDGERFIILPDDSLTDNAFRLSLTEMLDPTEKKLMVKMGEETAYEYPMPNFDEGSITHMRPDKNVIPIMNARGITEKNRGGKK
jgi:hypothetical protein